MALDYRITAFDTPTAQVGTVIFDPRVRRYISSGKLSLKDVDVDSMTITVNPASPLYGHVQPMQTTIEVKLNGKLIFRGRVLKPTRGMADGGSFSQSFSIESVEAYLMDTRQRQGEYHNISPKDFLAHLLDVHNAAVPRYKQFKLGNVTVTDPNESIYRYTGYDTTWQTINDKLITHLGGFLRVRFESDGMYLDYLAEVGEEHHYDNPIKLGRNLKSASVDVDPTKVITRLVPLGATIQQEATEGETTYANGTQPRVTIASANDGRDYIDIPDLQDEFGVIEGTVEWDDVNEPKILLTKAQAWIKAQTAATQSWQADVVELDEGRFAGGFKVSDSYTFLAPQINPRALLRIKQKDIDFLNPHVPTLTIGDKSMTLTSYQRQNRANQRKVLQVAQTAQAQAATARTVATKASAEAKTATATATTAQTTADAASKAVNTVTATAEAANTTATQAGKDAASALTKATAAEADASAAKTAATKAASDVASALTTAAEAKTTATTANTTATGAATAAKTAQSTADTAKSAAATAQTAAGKAQTTADAANKAVNTVTATAEAANTTATQAGKDAASALTKATAAEADASAAKTAATKAASDVASALTTAAEAKTTATTANTTATGAATAAKTAQSTADTAKSAAATAQTAAGKAQTTADAANKTATTAKSTATTANTTANAAKSAIAAISQTVPGDQAGDLLAVSAQGLSIFAGGEAGQALTTAIKAETPPAALVTLNGGKITPSSEMSIVVADGPIAFGVNYNSGGTTGTWWGIDTQNRLTAYKTDGTVLRYVGTYALDPSQDIHTVIIEGDYTLNGAVASHANLPETTLYGTLSVRVSPSGSLITHIFIASDGNMWTEASINGGKTWSAWIKH